MELQNNIALEYLITRYASIDLEGFAWDFSVCVAQVVAQTAGHPSRELYATLITVQLPHHTKDLLVWLHVKWSSKFSLSFQD